MSDANATIECPACGSIFVEYLIDPEARDVVYGTRGVMISCKICKHIFSISPEQARKIGVAEKPGEQIRADRTCTSCDYNLKTLIIGHRCPECGTAIDPVVSPIQAVPGKRSVFGIFLAIATVPLVALWLSALITKKNSLWLAVLATCGGLMTIQGVRAIITKQMVIGKWFTRTVTGWRAVAHGVAWSILGATFLTLATLFWLGIIR